MNPYFFPTLFLAGLLFWGGLNLFRRVRSRGLVVLGMILAVPGFVIAAYYVRIFYEPLWLYWFRSQPLSELAGGGIGLIAGWLQHRREMNTTARRLISPFFIPFMLVLCVAAPYLKQIVLRPDWSKYEDRWSQDVCLQSSESSCGPASAATLLRHFGIHATELEIARASFTTRSGTENWYLLRAIRRRGVAAHYVVTAPGVENIQYPAIAGVKLSGGGGTGHFIAILDEQNGEIITGDPMIGLRTLPRKALAELYGFTGFYLVCSPPQVVK